MEFKWLTPNRRFKLIEASWNDYTLDISIVFLIFGFGFELYYEKKRK